MNNLKELRKVNNKTQLDLANFLNIAKSTYCGYEIGTSEPNLETLNKLADFYNVSLDYLTGRKFKTDIGYIDDQTRAMIESFKKLSEVNKIKVVSYTPCRI